MMTHERELILMQATNIQLDSTAGQANNLARQLNFSLPDGWSVATLDQVASVQTGLAKGKKDLKNPVSLPYLRVANVQDGFLDLNEVKEIEVSRSEVERYSLRCNDVLMTEGGDADKLGRGHIWHGQIDPCLHQNHIFVVRTRQHQLDPRFFNLYTGSKSSKLYFLGCAKQTTNLATINSTQLRRMPVPLPPLDEQRRIVEILDEADAAVRATGNLIAAKINYKTSLAEQLLTGKRRFPEFVGRDWQTVRMSTIAKQISERCAEETELPVLSCTKHQGLVFASEYFGKRIHSENLSDYKVVRRGMFAYATNHIEEGSIGLQEICDAGLVSPMYTVFQVDETVVDRTFLFALLKTERYRSLFAAMTNGTVNRRGSLRWPSFATIQLSLPVLQEQKQTAEILKLLGDEIDLLKHQLAAQKAQKDGLMQALLTGQKRVKEFVI